MIGGRQCRDRADSDLRTLGVAEFEDEVVAVQLHRGDTVAAWPLDGGLSTDGRELHDAGEVDASVGRVSDLTAGCRVEVESEGRDDTSLAVDKEIERDAPIPATVGDRQPHEPLVRVGQPAIDDIDRNRFGQK